MNSNLLSLYDLMCIERTVWVAAAGYYNLPDIVDALQINLPPATDFFFRTCAATIEYSRTGNSIYSIPWCQR